MEPLSRGLPPPDPRSLYPLSSTELVEPPEKNSWPPPPLQKKILGSPLPRSVYWKQHTSIVKAFVPLRAAHVST
jgi:hypothetical protein